MTYQCDHTHFRNLAAFCSKIFKSYQTMLGALCIESLIKVFSKNHDSQLNVSFIEL